MRSAGCRRLRRTAKQTYPGSTRLSSRTTADGSEKTSNVTGHALHIPWGTKSGSSMYQFSLGITAGRYETHCPAWYLVASLENRHLAPMRTSLILPSWQLFPLSVLHGRTQNTGNSQNMSEFLMISSWALLSRILDEKIPASCSPPRDTLVYEAN